MEPCLAVVDVPVVGFQLFAPSQLPNMVPRMMRPSCAATRVAVGALALSLAEGIVKHAELANLLQNQAPQTDSAQGWQAPDVIHVIMPGMVELHVMLPVT